MLDNIIKPSIWTDNLRTVILQNHFSFPAPWRGDTSALLLQAVPKSQKVKPRLDQMLWRFGWLDHPNILVVSFLTNYSKEDVLLITKKGRKSLNQLFVRNKRNHLRKLSLKCATIGRQGGVRHERFKRAPIQNVLKSIFLPPKKPALSGSLSKNTKKKKANEG